MISRATRYVFFSCFWVCERFSPLPRLLALDLSSSACSPLSVDPDWELITLPRPSVTSYCSNLATNLLTDRTFGALESRLLTGLTLVFRFELSAVWKEDCEPEEVP